MKHESNNNVSVHLACIVTNGITNDSNIRDNILRNKLPHPDIADGIA